ncbi:WcaI family glycosyltransferase [Pontibacter diazotrophicus]|uniref:WcaI family glycosyltransferase n=1 Tax=Pontibacter diazotrophicus TaxID=1400979 RepID=UPI001C69DC47|nr:WcaI family glycosyltransferase [Pontibacter diazotrophicus]
MIGYNFYPEPTGIGKYSGEKVHWLAKNGYDCSVITTYPYYPYWKVQEPYHKNRRWYKTEIKAFASGGKITIHRCPTYVPENPSGLKRMLLDLSFLISAFFKLLQLMLGPKYDYVLTVVPSFQFGILGILYKKIRGAKLYYHIQDMQIEAARDLQMIKSERVIRTLFKVERYIFRQADVVSSISEGMIRKIEEKANKKVMAFPNWADINLFHPLENRRYLKKEFGFKASDTIVLYSGAIGEKQGLETILYAAQELQEMKNLKFMICGSGPYKERLNALAESLGLANVIFFPLQPFEKFNAFLNVADVHLVIQKANASDLVMPSKLTTILAVGGVALITANKGAGLHTLVAKHNMGILVDAENQQALNEGILKAILEDNRVIASNARAYAETNLCIDKIMQRFEASLVQEKVAVAK